jgi:hypothetical protein
LHTISNSKLRPEDELLLGCARTSIDGATGERLRHLLRREIDWQLLSEAAAAHGVKPLLSRNLNGVCQEFVPKPVLDQLQRYLSAHSLNNLFFARELVRLLGLLEKHGISAIPWKGPVLAATAYGDVALRQFSDLDILVRKHDAIRGKDLLFSAGYRLQGEKSAEDAAAFHALRQVYELMRDDGRVMVELHWAITSQTFYFPLVPASLWDRIETVSLQGAPVPNLAVEDLLLVLCVHGAKHHWSKLMWICDIAELLRAYAQKIDWTRLGNLARALGGWRMLSLGVLLARDLLGAKVPNDVADAMRAQPRIRFLIAEVHSALFTGGAPNAVERPAFYIQLRERPQDRLRCRLYLGYRKLAPQAQRWTLRLLHMLQRHKHQASHDSITRA